MVQARKLAEGRQHLGKGVGIARCPSHGEALLAPLHEEELTPLPGDLPQVAEADFQQAHVLVSLREAHLVLQAQLRHDGLVRVGRMAQPVGIHIAQAEQASAHGHRKPGFLHFLLGGKEEALGAFDEFGVHGLKDGAIRHGAFGGSRTTRFRRQWSSQPRPVRCRGCEV